VCSSIFVTDAWVSHLSFDNPAAEFYPLDGRRSISSQFQLLAALCRISRQVVNDELESLSTRQFISPKMLSPLTFKQEIYQLASSSLSLLRSEQKRMNRLIRSFNALDQLPTALGTNYIHTMIYNKHPKFFFSQ
jgi:hypothetical protein